MTRFVWTAWGLLVVVLDLPLAGWDVLPDIVGYAWVVVGLAGGAALAPEFVRARAAAAVGVPVAVVTTTPLLADRNALVFVALLLEAAVMAVLVHQLCSGLLRVAPDGERDTVRWAPALRIAALVAGGVMAAGIVLYSTPVGLLYPLGFLAFIVIGVLTVVLTYRVHRAGWVETDAVAPSA
ncbi:MAG: hypothetical protein ABIU87_12985 [Ornithinibacter sp.]